MKNIVQIIIGHCHICFELLMLQVEKETMIIKILYSDGMTQL